MIKSIDRSDSPKKIYADRISGFCLLIGANSSLFYMAIGANKTGVGLAETGTALYNRDNRYRRAVVAVRKTGSG